MSIVEDVFSIITKCTGYFVSGNKVKSVVIAALSITETFFSLLKKNLVSDIKDIKENFKKQIDADTKLKEAEAQKIVSEAVDAANKANLSKRNDAFAKVELRIKEAQAAKTEAKAKAIELKAKGQYEKDIADATARLLEAQSKIVQEGGNVFFNNANLQKLHANCQKELEHFEKEAPNDIESETVKRPEKYLSVAEAGLLEENSRPLKYIKNEYELQGNVVYDKATGLTWQQSGSEYDMTFGEGKEYIATLNQEKFAGYSDWHLPTLEQAKTLLEQTKTNGKLYIDPVFDNMQEWIWTSDQFSASSAWVVGFYLGGCFYSVFDVSYCVRAVR